MTEINLAQSCSALSLQAQEPLYGSIKPARHWLMIEVDQPMGKKALPESSLPNPVKEMLESTAHRLELGKVLLLRQSPRRVSGGRRFFLCVSAETQPRLYEFELQNYADLLDLDLLSLVKDPQALAAYLRQKPLYLVCTNGRRDPCCARNGLPVYQQLEGEFAPDVWQTSHVGGHRFSANLVLMPHALFYGRVPPQDARRLILEYQQGKMVLDYYRGRTCYEKIEQVAEYFIRREYTLPELNTLRHLQTALLADRVYQVTFEANGGKRTHTATLCVDPQGFSLLAGCFDQEPGSSPAYQLIGLE
jgi:hypothetical protein